MKRNIFVDPDIGNTLKKFTMYFSVFFLVFGLTMAIRNAGDTYAYTDADCPEEYNLVADNQCAGKPSSTIKCAKGTYDDDEGWCYYEQSCPTGYELASNNQCYKKPSSTIKCAKGTYDDDEGWCYYEQSCPTGYELASNNQCYSKPNGTAGNYSCTYGTFDEDEGWCYYYLTTPSGFEILSKNTTTMTYKASPNITHSCTYGDYDEDEGWCYYYLTTPSGFEILSKTKTTMTYKASPNITYSCTYGDYDEDEGWCYYYLTEQDSEPSNPATDNNPPIGEDTQPETPTVTEYQITFSVDGGKLYEGTTESTSLIRKLSSIDYSKYTAKKDNNTFNGWTTTKDSCTSPLKTGTVKLTADTTLYACYTADSSSEGEKEEETTNKTYKVTFNLDGGDLYKLGKKTTKTSYELSTIKLSDYTAKKTGYTFKGWSKNKDCSKIVSPNGKLTEDLTVWACYDVDKTTEEIDKSPQTGSTLLYLLFILGTVALGYAGYNAYKYSEVKK